MAGLKKAGLKVVKEGSIKAEVLDRKSLIDQCYYAIASKATSLKPDNLKVPGDKLQAQCTGPCTVLQLGDHFTTRIDSDGSGLMPLSTSYTPSKKHQLYFTEPLDYLREIRALDEAWKHEPRVRIANYITGPSKCIASSKYYSVWCLKECDEDMQAPGCRICYPIPVCRPC